MTSTSIADLFLAGVGPGILLLSLLALYSVTTNWSRRGGRWDGAEVRSALRDSVWAMLMPVIILGGIYSGIFTATESAAIAVVYALLVEMAIYRKLDWRGVATVSVETVKLLGGLFPVLMMALSINRLLIYEQVPAQIAAALGGMFGDPSSFMASSNLLLLLVGCLLDIGSAILVFAPILQPIAEVHGINAVHFGIIMTVNLEIGYLTPPMGLNIIVAMTAFRENFWFVCRSVLPFIGVLLVGLIIVVLWPALSLFLL